jgi:hypothetical protein
VCLREQTQNKNTDQFSTEAGRLQRFVFEQLK